MLNSASGDTFFAGTDDAFLMLAQSFGYRSDDLAGVLSFLVGAAATINPADPYALLGDVVRYHSVAGTVTEASLTDGVDNSLVTALGAALTESGGLLVDGDPDTASVGPHPSVIGNGITVYTIDSILLPSDFVQVATVMNGTNNADTLVGSGGNDVMNGNYGDDVINGSAGNDVIFGGNGSDILSGGNNNDEIYGGGQHDTLFGGSGNDTLFGDNGDDSLNGGSGNDTLYGGSNGDTLVGSGGDDILYGGTGVDVLSGGTNNDILFGGASDDFLNGDGGNDQLFGESGNDTMRGGAGNDILVGDGGNDRMYGGTGDDTFYGGTGDDRFYGDAGADTFVFSGVLNSDTVWDFQTGTDVAVFQGYGIADFAELMTHAQELGGHTFIDLGVWGRVQLHDVTLAELSATDFIFIDAPLT